MTLQVLERGDAETLIVGVISVYWELPVTNMYASVSLELSSVVGFLCVCGVFFFVLEGKNLRKALGFCVPSPAWWSLDPGPLEYCGVMVMGEKKPNRIHTL